MDIVSLNNLVGAVGKEKFFIQCIVNQFGTDALLESIDTLAVSNKTKNALKQLEGILHNNGDLVANVTGLTEIPKKILMQYEYGGLQISELIKHPERIDVDYRQFEKLLCLNKVMEDYTNGMENMQEIQEKYDEWER